MLQPWDLLMKSLAVKGATLTKNGQSEIVIQSNIRGHED